MKMRRENGPIDPFKQFLHFRVARVMNHKIIFIEIVFAIIQRFLIATKYVTSPFDWQKINGLRIKNLSL